MMAEPGEAESRDDRGSKLSERMTWLEHLNEHDLALLQRAADAAGGGDVRVEEGALEAALASGIVFDAVLTKRDVIPTTSTTPFLTFAVIVQRGWRDLQLGPWVEEWIGPRRRLPVLAAEELRAFLDRPERRLFLTELLASYTHVSSGVTWVSTRRGWRKRRFSELDPVRLASLLEVVPEEERPGVYRRLGDLSLFLTGVFPDHTELEGLGPHAEGRLLRLGVPGTPRTPNVGTPEDVSQGPVRLLERLGSRWYRLAAAAAPEPLVGSTRHVLDIAEHFVEARRALNFMTDRYLLSGRSQWFGGAPT